MFAVFGVWCRLVVWLVWVNAFRLDGYLYWCLLGVLCFDLCIAVMLGLCLVNDCCV